MPASYALPVSISHTLSIQLIHVNLRETQITCHTTMLFSSTDIKKHSTTSIASGLKKCNLKAVSRRIIPTVFTAVVGHHIMIHEDIKG